MKNQLHRVEVWTGTYFRTAELWEVGVYILVPHHTGTPICPSLAFQNEMLQGFQRGNDAREQSKLTRDLGWKTPHDTGIDTINDTVHDTAMDTPQDTSYEADMIADAELTRQLNALYQPHE